MDWAPADLLAARAARRERYLNRGSAPFAGDADSTIVDTSEWGPLEAPTVPVPAHPGPDVADTAPDAPDTAPYDDEAEVATDAENLGFELAPGPMCVICRVPLFNGQVVQTLVCSCQFHEGCVNQCVGIAGGDLTDLRCPLCRKTPNELTEQEFRQYGAEPSGFVEEISPTQGDGQDEGSRQAIAKGRAKAKAKGRRPKAAAKAGGAPPAAAEAPSQARAKGKARGKAKAKSAPAPATAEGDDGDAVVAPPGDAVAVPPADADVVPSAGADVVPPSGGEIVVSMPKALLPQSTPQPTIYNR